MNEPQMVETARVLGERMLKQGGSDLEQQLDYGFRLLTSRHLQPDEMDLIKTLYQEERDRFSHDPVAAEAMMQVGDYPRDLTLPLPELAAYAVVANIIMNYDEVYTKR
jgi:hypothetical protein